MNRKSILDSMLLTFLLILVIAFPVDYFITDTLSYYLVQIGLRLLLLIYYYFSIRRSGRRVYGDENWKEIAILSPVFLICVSNIILCAIYPTSVSFNGINKIFALEIVLDLLTAIVEEILFRLIFHNALRISNRLVRIIASAGIFAAFHALHFFAYFDPTIFIQVGYTFGLGIVLGFLMEYGNSVFMCMGLHFLYNAVNGTLFSYIFMMSNPQQLPVYYYVNIGVAAVVAIYLLIIFLVRYRKVNRLYFY